MHGLLPVLGLTYNALVWGTSWWPFRALEARGLHPLWATAFVYALSIVVIVATRPRALGMVMRTPTMWVLVLAAGCTNAAFNWGVVIGDVVRVVLLFYLMPLWAALLARPLLGERLTRAAGLRIAMAVAGAGLVLWPSGGATGLAAWPLPNSLPDVLGLVGGFAFALNNVMLRRESRQPEEARALAMFLGGSGLSAVLAATLAGGGHLPWPPAPDVGWLAIAGVLSVVFLTSNLALQYGAARLPANVTAVVMLSEVLFAALSALALGGGALSPPLLGGGALIVAAAVLATRRSGAPAAAT